MVEQAKTPLIAGGLIVFILQARASWEKLEQNESESYSAKESESCGRIKDSRKRNLLTNADYTALTWEMWSEASAISLSITLLESLTLSRSLSASCSRALNEFVQEESIEQITIQQQRRIACHLKSTLAGCTPDGIDVKLFVSCGG